MPKFPTEVEQTILIPTHRAHVYEHFWNVVETAKLIPGLAACRGVSENLYCFTYEPKTQGPVTIVVTYTSLYRGNGSDLIEYETVGTRGDNADVKGSIHLRSHGASTRVTLRQMLAPDVPVPRLLQGLARPFIERQATEGLKGYLANVKRNLTDAVKR